jgi:hypothetical protein
LFSAGGQAAGWHYNRPGQIAEPADTERIFSYSDIAGKTMQYTTNTDFGSRQPLTVNWPAIVSA